MQLVFATSNKNKIIEVKSLIPPTLNLVSLIDIGCYEDIPETGETLRENALIKARYVYDKYKLNCFADDSGLEVHALNGAPGVFSARYAGEEKNVTNNNSKLLSELKNVTDRKARFVTVIALILNGEEHIFEGIVNGTIAYEMKGVNGFGYDPVFIPTGYRSTFAEMDPATKNAISHRAMAIDKLVSFLKEKF